MKKYKIRNQVIYANSLHDALEIYKHKVKDEVYYEDIDSSSEAKKYAKKFGLEVEGRRAPWGGYEFVFEGNPQDLKKLVQELKRMDIEPTWSSVGDSKVKDEENVIYEVATAKVRGGRMDHEYFESKEKLLAKYPGKDNGSVVKLQGFVGPFNNGMKNGKKVLRYEDRNASYMDSKVKDSKMR